MSNAAKTITVTNLSSTTTEQSLKDYFSFHGTITSVKLEGKGKAVVEFEKETAAESASHVHGTLDGSDIDVKYSGPATAAAAATSATAKPEEATSPTTGASTTAPSDPASAGQGIRQEDKAKATIAAEYLAHGYALKDQVIQRAIEFDQKQNISSRFLSWFKSFDEKNKIVERSNTLTSNLQTQAKNIDERHDISGQAKKFALVGQSYLEKALNSPTGSKVRQFYTSTTKQVQDVHEEAQRIKAHREKQASQTSASASTAPAGDAAAAAGGKGSEAAPASVLTGTKDGGPNATAGSEVASGKTA